MEPKEENNTFADDRTALEMSGRFRFEHLEIKRLSDAKDDLEPLSVLLFRGTGLISEIILDVERVVDSSPALDEFGTYSHAGVLVNSVVFSQVPRLLPGQWAVYEITCSGKIAGDETPDLFTGKPRFGTQVRDLESVLGTYPGEVFVLSLRNNPVRFLNTDTPSSYENRLANIRSACDKYFLDNLTTLYQLNLIRLLSSAFPCLRPLRNVFPLSKYWKMCSQLVIGLYQEVGIVPREIEAEDVLPEDFIYDAEHRLDVTLFNPPPIRLTRNPNSSALPTFIGSVYSQW